jgi:hypothetical protein
MRIHEIEVNGNTDIDVQMLESMTSLGGIVVIGYGAVKKSDLTRPVSQVSNENLIKGINSSVDQAMIGRAASVQIRQTSSEPGGGISVRIRRV